MALFVCLSILGVKFALILAVFSGFAEIVPIIGPIVAASVAALAAYLGGGANFGLAPLQTVLAVIVIYAVIRQTQDYLVNPYVMGKITKLHPLVILFAVIAGEHIAGVLGLILAVPIAGVIRIIFEYSLDKINQESH
jgi:predicted PurR-regulated permease PerM